MTTKKKQSPIVEEVKELEAAAEAAADGVPTFVLRADQPGHIRALMAAAQELPAHAGELHRKIREFDLWLEENR